MTDPFVRLPITAWREGESHRVEAELPSEHELSIRLDGSNLVTLLCLPTQMQELVVGFLHAEGFIRSKNDLASLVLNSGPEASMASVRRRGTASARPDPGKTSWILATGCGGSLTLSRPENRKASDEISCEERLQPDIFYRLMADMSSRAETYKRTGGLHSAALADRSGRILFMAEDIGRHNAADKVNGARLLADEAPEPLILVTTGRITSEICWKALRMKSPWVASPSTTSSRAQELAAESGITLVGSIRGRRLKVYSHAWRVQV